MPEMEEAQDMNNQSQEETGPPVEQMSVENARNHEDGDSDKPAENNCHAECTCSCRAWCVIL